MSKIIGYRSFLSPTLSLSHTHTTIHALALSCSRTLSPAPSLGLSLAHPPSRSLSRSLSLLLIRFRPVYMALRVVRGLAALMCQLIATMDQLATTPRVVAIN